MTKSRRQRFAEWLLGTELATISTRIDDSPGWQQYGRSRHDRSYAEAQELYSDALTAWRKNPLALRTVQITYDNQDPTLEKRWCMPSHGRFHPPPFSLPAPEDNRRCPTHLQHASHLLELMPYRKAAPNGIQSHGAAFFMPGSGFLFVEEAIVCSNQRLHQSPNAGIPGVWGT